MSQSALSGIRVVDLSEGIAGSYCTQLLAECGAEVIAVRPPDRGQTVRRPDQNQKESAEVIGRNPGGAGKRSITLDVLTPSGQVVLRRLLRHTDVFVANGPNSILRRSRLSYDDLRVAFPSLICCTIGGSTDSGTRYRERKDPVISALTDLLGAADSDGGDVDDATTQAEHLTGAHAWIGILVALTARSKGGGGEHVEVSVSDALVTGGRGIPMPPTSVPSIASILPLAALGDSAPQTDSEESRDNAAILGEIGYGPDELRSLEERGVI